MKSMNLQLQALRLLTVTTLTGVTFCTVVRPTPEIRIQTVKRNKKTKTRNSIKENNTT